MKKFIASFMLAIGLIGAPAIAQQASKVEAAGCWVVLRYMSQGTPYYYAKAHCETGSAFRAKIVCSNGVSNYGYWMKAGPSVYSFATCASGTVARAVYVQQ